MDAKITDALRVVSGPVHKEREIHSITHTHINTNAYLILKGAETAQEERQRKRRRSVDRCKHEHVKHVKIIMNNNNNNNMQHCFVTLSTRRAKLNYICIIIIIIIHIIME